MKSRSSRAFTLIELLTVLATIITLASLLFPALTKAKRKVIDIQCRHTFKQWGLGMTLYLDDNDGCLPRERGMDGKQSWMAICAATNSDVWYNAIPPSGGMTRA